MKDWKKQLLKEILTDYNMDYYRAHTRTNTINFIDQLISERDKEIIKIIKTPMSTEFEDVEEESADYSIEDFRTRLLNLLKNK